MPNPALLNQAPETYYIVYYLIRSGKKNNEATFKLNWYPICSWFLTSILKHKVMRSLLYIVAVILVIGWAIGTFAYSAGGLIYVLLVLAVISFIFGILRRDTVV